MSIEEELKLLILKEYKSLRQFAPYTGLPYSTIAAILKRGILNSNIENIFRICEALNISVDALASGRIEKNPDKIIIEREAKHSDQLAAYASFFMKNGKFMIDDKPLDSEEMEFLNDSFSLIVEQIRNKRNRMNKK